MCAIGPPKQVSPSLRKMHKTSCGEPRWAGPVSGVASAMVSMDHASSNSAKKQRPECEIHSSYCWEWKSIIPGFRLDGGRDARFLRKVSCEKGEPAWARPVSLSDFY